MADTPDLNQITNLTTTQRANTQNLLGTQNTAISDYMNRYTNAIKGQETMGAMANRIGKELNLPTLKENAYNINKTVNELPATYNAATRGFDVNSNQLSRIIGQKTSELTPALNTANNALSNAQSSLDTQMGYGVADQNKELLPYATEKDLLSDRMARETSLYSTDNQNELNGLIQKIQSGITLSEGEKARANQLAIAEAGYKNVLEKARIEAPSSYSPYASQTDGYNFTT